MLGKWKILIIIVVTALLTQFAGYAVRAAMPEAFLTEGTSRYAVAYVTGSELLFHDDGWQNIPGMIKYISIPAGKTADVMVIFCGEAYSDSANALFVRAYVGGILMLPPETILQEEETVSSRCVTFYRINVPAGTPAVRLQWWASNTFGNLYDRTMIVIANVH